MCEPDRVRRVRANPGPAQSLVSSSNGTILRRSVRGVRREPRHAKLTSQLLLSNTSRRKVRTHVKAARNSRVDADGRSSRVFVPCPSCRGPIELLLDDYPPGTLECLNCGSVLKREGRPRLQEPLRGEFVDSPRLGPQAAAGSFIRPSRLGAAFAEGLERGWC